MKATITWQDKACFLGESGSGHQVMLDGPPDLGGENRGIRPMECLLIGLGGCSAFDVVNILRKSRQNIQDCRVEISAERADAIPSVFTKIHLHFIVEGAGLRLKAVERAIALSAEKYCSASLMLQAGGVEITHDFEILTATA